MDEVGEETVLEVYVIYDRPSDFPGHVVVRCQKIVRGQERPIPDPRCVRFRDTMAARAWVRSTFPHVVLLQGEGVDPDPCIYEVWG